MRFVLSGRAGLDGCFQAESTREKGSKSTAALIRSTTQPPALVIVVMHRLYDHYLGLPGDLLAHVVSQGNS